MFLFVSIFSSVLAFANNAAPQPKLSDSEIAGIDRLFARWNRTNSPGFAVGVIRNGSLVFAKGYGMSNLEYGIPITPRSPFYIASMSKQFTAACAAVLVQQGRLRLDDDVRKYIPEMPDYGKRLTIDHLIHHTGGVREWSSLVLFAGRDLRYEDRLDNEDVFRLLRRQKSLEFDPGAEYRYSSGGYQLLTVIIERMLLFPNPKAPILWNSKNMLWTGFGEIIFHRDALGRLKGLTIGDERVSAVLFTKLPSSESPIN